MYAQRQEYANWAWWNKDTDTTFWWQALLVRKLCLVLDRQKQKSKFFSPRNLLLMPSGRERLRTYRLKTQSAEKESELEREKQRNRESHQKHCSASWRIPKFTFRGRFLLGFLQTHSHVVPLGMQILDCCRPYFSCVPILKLIFHISTLKMNQDEEAWIRSIENLVKPPNDQANIQATRTNCQGSAELITNSPVRLLRVWETFKASLRNKFRGTCTSTDFY